MGGFCLVEELALAESLTKKLPRLGNKGPHVIVIYLYVWQVLAGYLYITSM